jgi:predicted P-loop ATPase
MHQYNPVCDYLTECKENWFGDDVIEGLFNCFKIRPEYAKNRDEYLQLFFKWLVGAARLAFNDGSISTQGILVLQGPQGIGKTRFLYKLVPNKEWALEGVSIDPNSRDDIMKTCGFWIVELGEFAETLKKDSKDRLKQFFTQSKDVIRKPYAKGPVIMPRTTSFIGTINNSEFLTDSTGERRYWVIPIEGFEGLDNIDMSQVWGQIMNFVDMGAPHWLSADEIATVNSLNDSFKKRSSTELAIIDCLNWELPVEYWRKVTSTDLCKELDLPATMSGRVGRVIAAMMERDERIQKNTNNMTGRWYLLPPLLKNLE